jgi:hypothetical protein
MSSGGRGGEINFAVKSGNKFPHSIIKPRFSEAPQGQALRRAAAFLQLKRPT